jgi:hypothetical protein
LNIVFSEDIVAVVFHLIEVDFDLLKIASILRCLFHHRGEQQDCKHGIRFVRHKLCRDTYLVGKGDNAFEHALCRPIVTPLRQPQPIEDLAQERAELSE